MTVRKDFQINVAGTPRTLRKARNAEQALLMFIGDKLVAEANVGRAKIDGDGVATIEFRGETITAYPMKE